MLFVYQTPAFEKRMNKDFKDLVGCVKNLISRIEKKQAYTGFVPFDDCFFVKKKLMYKYRLIARSVVIDAGRIDNEEHELLVFHDMMIRKDPNYNNPSDSACFCKDPEGYAKRHQYVTETFESDCLEYCKKRLQEKVVFKPKKPVSDYESQLLYDQLNGLQEKTGNLDIYETREWVSSLKSEENRDLYETYLHRLYEVVVDAVACAAASDNSVDWDIRPVEYGSGNKKFISYYYNIDEMVFILGRIDLTEDQACEYIAKQEPLYADFNREKDLKRTLRSYPESIVSEKKDLELWKNIEHEQSNNMSLSSEELKILNRTLNSGTRKYPLFINGRAGSGKSTILQSLFTPYYFQYLKSENSNDASPVYFTYNEKLRISARETVSNLLKNHRYIGSSKLDDSEKTRITDKDAQNWKNVFRQFTEFLLDVAKIKKGYEFRDQCKIDFADFKRMFLKRFGKERDLLKKVSPEICWHVIRTYIKGDSVDAIMDLEEFKSEKNRSVSEDTFKLVYDKIWCPWYSTITLFADKGEGEFVQNVRPQYWDDQDLVRYILMEDENSDESSLLDQYFEKHPRFSAIFCDESQDFTHIELEAIPEMSLYLYRKVDRNYIDKIPFVFAGDPFQTLNPTGFSWEATERGFVDIIARALDKKAEHVSLEYRELKMNYRSASDIVKLSNAVQAVRAGKLNPDRLVIEPQRPWNDSKGSCLFFDWKDAEVWDWLEKNDDVSFVLPCDSSNRADFIKANSNLAEHLGYDSNSGDVSTCKYPVYSALDIKGLEYDKIVVYGFGAFDENSTDGMPGRFRKLLDSDCILNGNQNLEMEYFINRLYVAVTRSKKKLFILDDPSYTFWNKFKKTDTNNPIQWLSSILPDNCKRAWERDGDSVESHLEILQIGRASDLDGESAGEDKEAFAKELLRNGIENRNIEGLGQALKRYSIIKGENSSQCNEIRGCIYYLDSKFSQSSEYFDLAGRTVASNHSLFLAFDLSKADILPRMKELNNKKAECKDSAEYALICCCVEQPSDVSFLEALDKFHKMYVDYTRKSGHEIFSWKYDSEKWESLFNEALRRLPGCNLKNSKINDHEKEVAEKLLEETILQFDEVLIVQFLMHMHMYDKVTEIAEKTEDVKVKELANKASAFKLEFPKNIQRLNEFGESQTIYEVFQKECDENREQTIKAMDAGASKIVLKAMKSLKPAFNENYFGILFNTYIDADAWEAYAKEIKVKRSLNHKEKNVQLIWDMIHKRSDENYSRKVFDEMRKCNTLKDKELFNKFYIYCCIAAKCHPVTMDLKGCAGMLKNVFGGIDGAINKFDLSVNDIVEFGKFYEYIADFASKQIKDKVIYWERTLEFYNKALAELKKDNQLIQKRVIFCEDTLANLHGELYKLNNHNKLGVYNSDFDKAREYEDSARTHRKALGIPSTEKMEKIGNGNDENKWATELACKLWREDGYLIKHEPDLAKVTKSENPAAETPIAAVPEVEKPAVSTDEPVAVNVSTIVEAPAHVEPLVTDVETPKSEVPEKEALAKEDSAKVVLPVETEIPPAVEIPPIVDTPEEKEVPVQEEPSIIKTEKTVPDELKPEKTVEEKPSMDGSKNSENVNSSDYPESFRLQYKGYEFVTNMVDELYSLEIYAISSGVRLCRINADEDSFGKPSKGVIHEGNLLSYGNLDKITLVEEESGECSVSIGHWKFSVLLS